MAGKITNQELDSSLTTKLSNSDSHIGNTSNPHGVTYTQVGAEPANANIQTHIGNTSNPHGITPSQIGAEPTITAGTTGQYFRGDKTWQTIDLSSYAPLASPTFTGTVSGVSATMVGLGNVTNESKATMFTSPTFTGNPVFIGDPSFEHIFPKSNNTYDLGSTSLAWRNIYTNDLHLSNKQKEEGNDIDGTTGDWTIQEGENFLYIINNKTNKKYKFVLEEV